MRYEIGCPLGILTGMQHGRAADSPMQIEASDMGAATTIRQLAASGRHEQK